MTTIAYYMHSNPSLVIHALQEINTILLCVQDSPNSCSYAVK